jgi:hypothetical protein
LAASQPAGSHAKPEKAYQALLFFLLGQRPVFPGRAPVPEQRQVDLLKEPQAFIPGPSAKLSAENDFQLIKRGRSQFARLGVR